MSVIWSLIIIATEYKFSEIFLGFRYFLIQDDCLSGNMHMNILLSVLIDLVITTFVGKIKEEDINWDFYKEMNSFNDF